MDTATLRAAYPSDVNDEEWFLVAPYLTLMKHSAPQRDHDLREVFNALRWVVRTGSPWRYIPHDLPPWHTVYQQTRRWIKAGVFEELVADLRGLIRLGVRQHTKERTSSPRPSSSTAGRCVARPRVARVPGMTVPRRRMARRSTWWWTPWASS